MRRNDEIKVSPIDAQIVAGFLVAFRVGFDALLTEEHRADLGLDRLPFGELTLALELADLDVRVGAEDLLAQIALGESA